MFILCGHTPFVSLAFKGQNGRASSQNFKVKASCGAKGKKLRSKRHGRN